MNDSKKISTRTAPHGLSTRRPPVRRPATGQDQPAGTARAAGLAPGGATTVSKDREISGELDRRSTLPTTM